MAGKSAWTQEAKAMLAAGLVAIAVGTYAAYGWSSRNEETRTAPEAAKAPMDPLTGFHDPGYIGNLRSPSEDVPMGETAEAYSKAIDAKAAKDQTGFDQLKEAGSLFTVPSGTEAKMLGSEGAMVHVRVLAGTHGDEDGWTAAEFLK